ncbi:Fic family protein [Candidatus Finniella inopinata]|uniref:Fic family protein n=1 Tax=Candidatus Finniella inopinata TaxID=1696036 RepID=A0A4Q7DJ50_9PROT|nr:Fic family protein [Candidatus Finniella inopinata]RZI46873.1 Fic family protein [Candidatus Finniella inopinata]
MWIHQRQGWPNVSWNQENLSIKLASVRHQQGRLLGRMGALGFQVSMEAALQTLTADVVTTSDIEGERLNPHDVRSSIARRLGIQTAGMIETTNENVEGIVDVMLDATQNYQMPLTEERLYGWHAALFPTGRSGMRPIMVGAWRPPSAGPMQVVSGPIGREIIHFEVPEATRLKNEMTRFVTWFEEKESIDQVIKAGIAHLIFVTIHPFEDGNGRIARAIADMALARSDQTTSRFYSMSSQIAAERKAYYFYLEQQQRSGLDVTAWLDWFLDCLGRAIQNANVLLDAVFSKAAYWSHANKNSLNKRQKLIISRMLEDFKGFMRTSKYATMAKCSPDTALRDIYDLISCGLLVQNPDGGRNTSYRLATLEELSKTESFSNL